VSHKLSQEHPCRNILVVDDNTSNLDLLRRRLEKRGYSVFCLGSGEDVEATLETEQIDLILLDWMMPGRSGLEVLQSLRRIHSRDHLPIIIITAAENGSTASTAIKIGANDLIPKPIDMDVLIARMTAQIERRDATLQIEALRHNLEITIDQRTHELQSTNERLKCEIEERRLAETLAHRLARTDALTNLANRRSFTELLDSRLLQANASPTTFGLVFLDLNGFKPINDMYGHAVGDELLIEIGKRLVNAAPSDSSIARLGGDEFAIMLAPGSNGESAYATARHISSELAKPISLEGRSVSVSATFGAACFPAHGETTTDLMRRADLALIHAKVSGRNVFVFEGSLEHEHAKRRHQQSNLADHLHRKLFVPGYQPIVCLAGRQTIGFELLTRWRTDGKNQASPLEIATLADESGLIDTLLFDLLRQALPTIGAMPGQPFLSINVSTTQTRDPWFAQKLLGVLTEYNFPAKRLAVEVSERCLTGKLDAVHATLCSLKNIGVSVTLDDFGSGASSLSTLAALPIDSVKLDHELIGRLSGHEECQRLVISTMQACKALGLTTIAEGVECNPEKSWLIEMKCDQAQGYLFGRATDHPQTSDVLLARRA
jgi:diguanylate cyclase (GGDEF)-like protein